MNTNCKKTCNNWQEQYEQYLEEEKCRLKKEEECEMSKPDNTYGINPHACEHSRNRVYMNYTGADRLNWGKPNNQTSTMTKEQIKILYESNENTNAYTDGEKLKLSTLYNYNDDDIRQTLSGKVDKLQGYGLSQQNYTLAEKNKLQLLTIETASTVKQKYESNSNTNAFTDAEKQKLQTLQNYNDSIIINQLGNKVDKELNKGLSSNDYTDSEKQKLAGLESSKFRGKFLSFNSLPLTGNTIGSFAYVGDIGQDDQSYIWDNDDSKWVLNAGAGTEETPSSVKSKYESNPDTNPFTDNAKTKLDNLTNYDDTDIRDELADKIDFNVIVSEDKTILLESVTKNIESNISLFQEEFPTLTNNTVNISFEAVQILGIYDSGIRLNSTQYTLINTQTIQINTPRVGNYIEIQYTHLKTDL